MRPLAHPPVIGPQPRGSQHLLECDSLLLDYAVARRPCEAPLSRKADEGMGFARLLVALGLLAVMSGTLVGCSRPANKTSDGAGGVTSEEASENDSIESTREEGIEASNAAKP